MKKAKFEKKPSLKKETVANLSNNQMNSIKGGNTAASCNLCTFTLTKIN